MTTVHVLSRTVRVLLFEDATVQRCREASANTVLMMMNGIGPVGTLDGPDSFLKPLSEMFKPGGQILVDCGDVRHRQVVTGTGGLDWPARTGDYSGEAWTRLEYLGQSGSLSVNSTSTSIPSKNAPIARDGLQTNVWRDGNLRGMPHTT